MRRESWILTSQSIEEISDFSCHISLSNKSHKVKLPFQLYRLNLIQIPYLHAALQSLIWMLQGRQLVSLPDAIRLQLMLQPLFEYPEGISKISWKMRMMIKKEKAGKRKHVKFQHQGWQFSKMNEEKKHKIDLKIIQLICHRGGEARETHRSSELKWHENEIRGRGRRRIHHGGIREEGFVVWVNEPKSFMNISLVSMPFSTSEMMKFDLCSLLFVMCR